MTLRIDPPLFAIGKRRWWLGGGWDVLQGPGHWPLRLAWFREQHHAEAFVRLFTTKNPYYEQANWKRWTEMGYDYNSRNL